MPNTRAPAKLSWLAGTIALLVAGASQSAPFVTSDAVTQPAVPMTHCAFYLDKTPKVTVPVSVDAATSKIYCKMDLGALAVGNHTVTSAFVIVDPIWGTLEGSQTAPFVFSVPGQPGIVPGALRLTN